MNVKRAVVTVLAVLITVLVVMPAGAADTYYFAITDGRLFPCSYSYMPKQTADGILCPSQFLLDAGLGFKYDYRPAQNFYTIYTADKRLTFDLAQNSSFDSRWPYEAKIIRENGVYYLPLDFVAEYFNFRYSVISTSYGTAVRLRANSDTVDDKTVVSALDTQLSQAQGSYKAVNSSSPAEPSAVPSSAVPPTVRPSSVPSSLPSSRPTTSPSPSPPPAPILYLSFDVGTESGLAPVLDILDSYGIPATFFVTPEYIESNHGDMRRITGTGYALGIQSVLDMSSDESIRDVIEQVNGANRELRIAALTQTRIVSVPAGTAKASQGIIDALMENGYRFWEWQIDAKDRKSKPDTVAASLLTAISNANGACYVRFSCNDITAETLKKLLPQLNQLNASYYAISEARPPSYRS